MIDSEDNQTVVDYGPLAALVGVWKGDQGVDLSPSPDGPIETPFYEEIHIEAAGSLSNARQQNLAMLRYWRTVRRKSNDEVFHDEVGYWLWDAATQQVTHSLTIPRGMCILACGGVQAQESSVQFEVSATDDHQGGIVSSPFMQEKARQKAYALHISVKGNVLRYKEENQLEIYGKEFAHTDTNVMTRI